MPYASRLVLPAALFVLLARAAPAAAQPTYKLGVKPDLKPLATLQFQGATLQRSEVADDPGFRLQYHFKKDGKTVAQVDARATPDLELPLKEAGTYTVVLELFYPAYKGGGAQKGEFKPISEPLTFTVKLGGEGKPQVEVLPKPAPVPAK